MYNCIDFSPRQEKIPENYRYFVVTKEYPKPTPKDGKKKVTREQMKEYQEMISDRNKMFLELAIGNVIDMGNRHLNMDDITKNIHWLFSNQQDYFIYKIESINALIYRESYSRTDKYQISSFKVVKIMESITELLDDLSETIYYHDAFHNIFDHSRYINNREEGLKLFEYFHTNHPDKKIYLADILYDNLHSYHKHNRYCNEDNATEFAEILHDNGLIDLFEEYTDHEHIVGELIKSGWCRLAVEYIKSVKSLEYGDIYFKDKYKDDILSAVRLHTDNKYVQEIIELLGLDNTYLTLIVKEYIDDGYDEREIERKQFKNINEARTYVITKYNIPFEKAAKDVEYWHNEDNPDLYFETK